MHSRICLSWGFALFYGSRHCLSLPLTFRLGVVCKSENLRSVLFYLAPPTAFLLRGALIAFPYYSLLGFCSVLCLSPLSLTAVDHRGVACKSQTFVAFCFVLRRPFLRCCLGDSHCLPAILARDFMLFYGYRYLSMSLTIGE